MFKLSFIILKKKSPVRAPGVHGGCGEPPDKDVGSWGTHWLPGNTQTSEGMLVKPPRGPSVEKHNNSCGHKCKSKCLVAGRIHPDPVAPSCRCQLVGKCECISDYSDHCSFSPTIVISRICAAN